MPAKPLRFVASHPKALAVTCSDGRFTRAVEDLFQSLGHERLDHLAVPGGPALLEHGTARFFEVDTIWRAFDFLVKSHAIEEVLLLAHEGCGYYRARSEVSPAEVQVKETLAAAKKIRSKYKNVRVHTYFAMIRKDSSIDFMNLERD